MIGAVLLNSLFSCPVFSLEKKSKELSKSSFSFKKRANKKQKHYRVVLDPGHGGIHMSPSSVYGDKFDILSGQYQDKFRPGAYHNGMSESEETYALARMIQSHLFLTQTREGQQIFKDILKKYTRMNIKEVIPIDVFLSRENTYHNIYFDIQDDINAPYRLYDYPDIHTGKMKQGRISKINSLQPNLVVSLHLTSGKKNKVGALNAVITPGFHTFKIALDYAKKPHKRWSVRRRFQKSPYSKLVSNQRKKSI